MSDEYPELPEFLDRKLHPRPVETSIPEPTPIEIPEDEQREAQIKRIAKKRWHQYDKHPRPRLSAFQKEVTAEFDAIEQKIDARTEARNLQAGEASQSDQSVQPDGI